jgi:hypothetical protein
MIRKAIRCTNDHTCNSRNLAWLSRRVSGFGRQTSRNGRIAPPRRRSIADWLSDGNAQILQFGGGDGAQSFAPDTDGAASRSDRSLPSFAHTRRGQPQVVTVKRVQPQAPTTREERESLICFKRYSATSRW